MSSKPAPRASAIKDQAGRNTIDVLGQSFVQKGIEAESAERPHPASLICKVVPVIDPTDSRLQ